MNSRMSELDEIRVWYYEHVGITKKGIERLGYNQTYGAAMQNIRTLLEMIARQQAVIDAAKRLTRRLIARDEDGYVEVRTEYGNEPAGHEVADAVGAYLDALDALDAQP